MSKERLELADRIIERIEFADGGSVSRPDKLNILLSSAERNLIVAALRASAVAEPVARGWNEALEEAANIANRFDDCSGSFIAERIFEFAADTRSAHPAPAAPVPAIDRCAKCGEPRKEHAYNGACYGVCGEFVAAAPTREEIAACLKHIKLETYRPDDATDYAVTIVGHSKAIDAILALKAAPAK